MKSHSDSVKSHEISLKSHSDSIKIPFNPIKIPLKSHSDSLPMSRAICVWRPGESLGVSGRCHEHPGTGPGPPGPPGPGSHPVEDAPVGQHPMIFSAFLWFAKMVVPKELDGLWKFMGR